MSERSVNHGRSREDATIEQAAAEWFGRCEIGLTPDEETEFARWLEADERHGEAMREMDETWTLLDGLRQVRRPLVTTGAALPPPPVAPMGHKAKSRGRRPALLAMAAALVVVASTVWFSAREQHVDRQFATGPEGMKKVELLDGSIVHLNANTGVRVHFTGLERRVELERGEAHFAVTQDSKRPFIVAAGEVKVRAVGTAFNVRRDVQAVEVLVLEGRVTLNHAATGGSLLIPRAPAPPDSAAPTASTETPRIATVSTSQVEPALLRAGQRVRVNTQDAVGPVATAVQSAALAEIERVTSWQSRQLEFDFTPLAEVVAQFNRHNSRQLVIADADLGTQLFGGTFRADNCEVFVDLLEQRFGVKAERSVDRILLRRNSP